MKPTLSRSIGYSAGGYYVEIYTDDDDASGYGDHAMVGRWYGTRAECEALDARTVRLRAMAREDSPDPFDLACERRHDASTA